MVLILAQRRLTDKWRDVIFTAGLRTMLRCSIAINTRQQHSTVHTALYSEQTKEENEQSLSGLTVEQWAPVSLRLALNDLSAKFYAKNRTITVPCSLVDRCDYLREI
jgi:hypothetical protein